MAVGFPAKTTYANGDVFSADDINSTNGTINLLTSSTLSVAAAKNFVMNGGYDIWQRGTSIALANTSSNYSADRWGAVSSTTGTVSRQVTGDTTNLPSIQYCARAQRTNGQTGTGTINLAQYFESSNAIPLAGKTVTLSFYARRGANYSSASNALAANLYTGTGTDQNPFAVSYTGSANPVTGTATLTTTWQRFSYTGTLAATATELYINFTYTPSGTAGAADYFEITGVQLELGSTATTFSRAGGTIQGELAACQRYYQNTGANPLWSGNVTTGLTYYMTCQLPVIMRISPTCTFTITNNNGFPATNPAGSTITPGTIWATAVANTTGGAAFFGFTYTASAEL